MVNTSTIDSFWRGQPEREMSKPARFRNTCAYLVEGEWLGASEQLEGHVLLLTTAGLDLVELWLPVGQRVQHHQERTALRRHPATQQWQTRGMFSIRQTLWNTERYKKSDTELPKHKARLPEQRTHRISCYNYFGAFPKHQPTTFIRRIEYVVSILTNVISLLICPYRMFIKKCFWTCDNINNTYSTGARPTGTWQSVWTDGHPHSLVLEGGAEQVPQTPCPHLGVGDVVDTTQPSATDTVTTSIKLYTPALAHTHTNSLTKWTQ